MKVGSETILVSKSTLSHIVSIEEQRGELLFSMTKEDFDTIEKEREINYNLMNFFLFEFINRSHSQRDDFLLLSHECLKQIDEILACGENNKKQEIFQFFAAKDILHKKFLLMPFFNKSNGWSLAVIENIYANFVPEVIKSEPMLSQNFNKKEKPKLKILYFDNEGSINRKELKNGIILRLEK
jgi:hypothetical protein